MEPLRNLYCRCTWAVSASKSTAGLAIATCELHSFIRSRDRPTMDTVQTPLNMKFSTNSILSKDTLKSLTLGPEQRDYWQTAHKARKFLRNYELVCYEKYANTAHQKSYRRSDMVGKQVPTTILLSYILCFAFHGFGLIEFWLMSLNRYPGVACDIPSHSYTFSFDLIRIGAASMLLVKKLRSTSKTSTEGMIYLDTWGSMHWSWQQNGIRGSESVCSLLKSPYSIWVLT